MGSLRHYPESQCAHNETLTSLATASSIAG
jgi:hypothetical protein